MTPVEVTSTSVVATRPGSDAAATSSALASPTAPVATFAFFDTTTIACSVRRRRVDVRPRRWGREARPGEHRRGRARRVGGDDGEVVGVVLDADVRDVRTEAPGKWTLLIGC